MCLGIPMTIVEGDEIAALCSRGSERRLVSMLLVGSQTPGTQVLVHIDRAVRVLDEAEAEAIGRAIDGLEAALNGEAFEHLFTDLIDREPQLPEHLR